MACQDFGLGPGRRTLNYKGDACSAQNAFLYVVGGVTPVNKQRALRISSHISPGPHLRRVHEMRTSVEVYSVQFSDPPGADYSTSSHSW